MLPMPLRLHVNQNVCANNLSIKDITVLTKYKYVRYFDIAR